MLVAQAVCNAGVFGIFVLLFSAGGPFSRPFLTLALVTAMFALSALLVKKFGRVPLILTWVATIVLIAPHLPGGMMDGGIIGIPMFLYLIAGLAGACFLPKKDSACAGAPT